jgi:S-adenosylmethionine hydrolase
MSIITLTTDFGVKDHFVGALKGKILKQVPQTQIIDISHHIDLFNISEASYVIKSSYDSFQKGTVHLIGVDCERTENTKHIIVHWKDHYFVCADNGIMSLVCQNETPEGIYEREIPKRFTYQTDLELLIEAACHIVAGGNLSSISKEIFTLKPQNELKAVVEMDTIKGNVIYIDQCGNCITNITRDMFIKIGNQRNFEIRFGTKSIKKIHKTYSDFSVREGYTLKEYEGEKLALFNEAGHLEIAIYKSNPNTTGTAKTLLGLKYRDVVSIIFK